jgi:hypothetical protein
MSDTRTHHPSVAPTEPIEGDGVSYRGIVWFAVILAATTIFCQLLVWGMFEFMDYREVNAEQPRSPLATPTGALPPGPVLLTNEPANLDAFQRREDLKLSTYGWTDEAAGVVRIPIDRAKALLLERGLPVQPAAPADAPATATPAPDPSPAAQVPGGH